MTATMGHRRVIRSLIWCLLSFPAILAERLSPDQKAPQFARGSGGLILNPPFEDEQKTVAGPPATSVVNEDGVQREEMATLKLVDGELVRVVEGSYSYKSPEGIPVSVHYVADENGYRAGFRLGAAATGVMMESLIRPLGPTVGSIGPNIGPRIGPPGQGGTTYLPSKPNVDRSYLPPQ
ncbi:endocuticle structural glycoprotein SgAbd-1 [Monomorium pharaonis]|uniref:endocuticle structural glycoprotein SgAbd-1 n=1 Tax=Monomorium pharaonis TaxID=307658 RepID=UPI00174745BE|nr:endocuticle structural glycoprotein SgAbd-1 [Monomorium pharaonis]